MCGQFSSLCSKLEKPDDDKHDFNDRTYFSILQCCLRRFPKNDLYPTVHLWYNDSVDIVRILVVLHFGIEVLKIERDATLENTMCRDSKLGVPGSIAPYHVLQVHRLSCRGKIDLWFDVVQQYCNQGTFLSVCYFTHQHYSLYFFTSSDSGSLLVIYCLSANGGPESSVMQRIFWPGSGRNSKSNSSAKGA